MATIKKNKIEYDLEIEDLILYDGYNYYLLTEDESNPLNKDKVIKSQAVKMIKDKEICETWIRSYGFYKGVNNGYKKICENAIQYALAIDCGFAHDCRHFKKECECCKYNPMVIVENDIDEEYDDFYFSRDDKKAIEQGWKLD